MTLSFLKTKDVPIDDLNVTITQLSGLERLDFMDYCSEIPEPDRPAKPEETASETEQENYLIELNKYTQKCSALTFLFKPVWWRMAIAKVFKTSTSDITRSCL